MNNIIRYNHGITIKVIGYYHQLLLSIDTRVSVIDLVRRSKGSINHLIK